MVEISFQDDYFQDIRSTTELALPEGNDAKMSDQTAYEDTGNNDSYSPLHNNNEIAPTETSRDDVIDEGQKRQNEDDNISVSSGVDVTGSSGESLLCVHSKNERNQEILQSGSCDSLLSAGNSSEEQLQKHDHAITSPRDSSPLSQFHLATSTVRSADNSKESQEDNNPKHDEILFRPTRNAAERDDRLVSEASTHYSSRDSLLSCDSHEVSRINSASARETLSGIDNLAAAQVSSRESLLSDDSLCFVKDTRTDGHDDITHAQTFVKTPDCSPKIRRRSYDDLMMKSTYFTRDAQFTKRRKERWSRTKRPLSLQLSSSYGAPSSCLLYSEIYFHSPADNDACRSVQDSPKCCDGHLLDVKTLFGLTKGNPDGHNLLALQIHLARGIIGKKEVIREFLRLGGLKLIFTILEDIHNGKAHESLCKDLASHLHNECHLTPNQEIFLRGNSCDCIIRIVMDSKGGLDYIAEDPEFAEKLSTGEYNVN